jgi:photosystem I subunit 4
METNEAIRYPVVVRFEAVNYSGTNTNNFAVSELVEV